MEDLIQRLKAKEERREKALRMEGIKEGIKEGVEETIIEIIRNMLKANQDEETIMKYTNAKKEDIERIKKELEMQAN